MASRAAPTSGKPRTGKGHQLLPKSLVTLHFCTGGGNSIYKKSEHQLWQRAAACLSLGHITAALRNGGRQVAKYFSHLPE